MPVDARVIVLETLIRLLLGKPRSWWKERYGYIVTTLDEVVRRDKDDGIKGGAANVLDELLGIIDYDSISSPRGDIRVIDMRRRADGAKGEGGYADLDFAEQVRDWLNPPSSESGSQLPLPS